MDRTATSALWASKLACLNPYSNGIWIEPILAALCVYRYIVLILILMEYG